MLPLLEAAHHVRAAEAPALRLVLAQPPLAAGPHQPLRDVQQPLLLLPEASGVRRPCAFIPPAQGDENAYHSGNANGPQEEAPPRPPAAHPGPPVAVDPPNLGQAPLPHDVHDERVPLPVRVSVSDEALDVPRSVVALVVALVIAVVALNEAEVATDPLQPRGVEPQEQAAGREAGRATQAVVVQIRRRWLRRSSFDVGHFSEVRRAPTEDPAPGPVVEVLECYRRAGGQF